MKPAWDLSDGTMNNTTCNNILWPGPVNNVFIVYSALLLVLGLLLNSVALWVFCHRMHQWTETRVYMTNLAVADLCLLCSLPFVLYSLKYDVSDTPICQLSQGIYLVNRYMSISLVTAIAVDRYVAVRHPLRARELRSPGQAAAVCVTLWVIVITSLVVRWRLGVQEGGFCFGNQGRHNFSTSAFSLLGFYLPLAIVVFCSLQVVTVLARRPVTDVGQAEATRKATHMVWANLVVFIVCFLPLHVVLTVQVSLNLHTCAVRHTFSRALSITAKLSDTNCCLDAVCYYYMAKEFQEASKPATSSTKPHKSQDCQSPSLT
ncbi:G-protein coupled receptor 35 isoform X2 [Apodemus sylvaticus]|uniref:G-protein coupled receptor 35 isoform X2 n=1 Tax=Apodemus sylvaticus TaxID=10129 RepID=UPI002244D19F|nr:G-protein coupled receptor 35 isoform X2 [Apodemus sylvaticus]